MLAFSVQETGGIMRQGGYYETPLQLTLIGYSNISDTKIIIVIILPIKTATPVRYLYW